MGEHRLLSLNCMTCLQAICCAQVTTSTLIFIGIMPKSDYLRLPGQNTIKRNIFISFQHSYGVPETP